MADGLARSAYQRVIMYAATSQARGMGHGKRTEKCLFQHLTCDDEGRAVVRSLYSRVLEKHSLSPLLSRSAPCCAAVAALMTAATDRSMRI
jgi:hypothetical protein